MTIDLHNPSPDVIETVATAIDNAIGWIPEQDEVARVAIAAMAPFVEPVPPPDLDLTISVHKAMRRAPKGPAAQAMAAVDAVRAWDRQHQPDLHIPTSETGMMPRVLVHPVDILFASKHTHYITLYRTEKGFGLLISSYGLPTYSSPGMEDDEEWFEGTSVADVFRQATEFSALTPAASQDGGS